MSLCNINDLCFPSLQMWFQLKKNQEAFGSLTHGMELSLMASSGEEELWMIR